MHENVIRSLRYTNAKYLIAGPSSPTYLESLKSLEEWGKVEYKGVVDHNKINQIYSKSFAGVVLLDYSPNVGYHKGTLGVLKMFEYMMAGLPVIATDFDLWKEIIEGNDCGVCVDPYDVHAIADAINLYANNPEIARKQGENGRRAVKEKYNWATQEPILFDLYQKLIG